MKKYCLILVAIVLFSINIKAQDSISIDSYSIRYVPLLNVLDSVIQRVGEDSIAYVLQLEEKNGDIYCCFMHIHSVDLIDQITGRNPIWAMDSYKIVGSVKYNSLSIYILSKIDDNKYLKYFSRIPSSEIISYNYNTEESNVYLVYNENVTYVIRDGKCLRLKQQMQDKNP
jgi:hypothetical protein